MILALLLLSLALVSCVSSPPVEDADASRVRIAACQIEATGDPEEAFVAIDSALALASAEGAQLACFPETCLFGWVNPEAHVRADAVPGPTTVRLGEFARKYEIMIALGLAERSEEGLHDSAVLIDRDGTLLLVHRKVNVLSELMDPPYAPGPDARSSVVETRLGSIGMLVCADTFREDVVGDIAAQEPDLVLVPYGWAAPEEAWPDHGKSLHSWISHTARTVGAPVVGVDGTGTIGHGPWKGHVFGGQSQAVDARGEELGTLADRQVEVRVFEIDLEAAAD